MSVLAKPRSLTWAQVAFPLLVSLEMGCARGSEKVPQRQPQAEANSPGACPLFRGQIDTWPVVRTRAGRISFRLPSTYRSIPGDSSELWATDNGNIGYRVGTAFGIADEGDARAECSEAIAGNGRLRYYHA